MEAAEVYQIVEREILGDWSSSNAHGVDLKRCLINPPERRVYQESGTQQEMHLWLVLEEMPDDHTGYSIAFDDAASMFGLATRGWHGEEIFLGYYGTFLETLEAM